MILLKRISCIIICISLISLFPISIYGVSQPPAENQEYIETKSFLDILGVIRDFSAEAVLPVSRIQFLSAVLRGLNLDIPSENTVETGFSDVPASHPFASSIIIGLNKGIIYPAADFAPDRPVTRNEAIKMALVALGYRERAELTGGFPAGYLMCAANARLLSNVDNGDIFTVKDAIMLIFNMLNANIYEQTVYSAENNRFALSDETILSLYHNIYQIKGQVTATDLSGISKPDKRTADNTIEIAGQLFDCYLHNKYLGYSVKAYYRDDKINKEEVIHIIPASTNIIKEFTASYIESYSDFTLNYYLDLKDRETRKLSLARNFNLIYNGKAHVNYTDADFKPSSGFVTLLDTDNDSKYDIVFIKDFKTMIIKNIDVDRSILYDVNGEEELYLDDINLGIFSDGASISIEDLTAGMCIGYTISLDKECVEIHTLNELSGTINSISGDDIYIDDVPYQTSYYYDKYYGNTKMSVPLIFYLGLDGVLTAVQTRGGLGYQYGYLIQMRVSPKIDQTVSVKLIDIRGKIAILDLKDKITLNGNSKDSLTEVTAAFMTAPPSPETYQQLIKYTLNADGKINKIVTGTPAVDLAKPFANPDVDSDLLVKFFDGSRRYKSSARCFISTTDGGSFRIDDSSIVFTVPKPGDFDYDEKKFSLTRISGFVDDQTYPELKAFSIDRSGKAGVLVNVGTSANSTISNDTVSSLVDRIVRAVDDEGDVKTKLFYWSNGTFGSIFLSSDAEDKLLGTPIASGDVIRFSIDEVNEVANYELDFIYSSKTVVPPVSDENSILKYKYGQVYSFENNHVYLAPITGGVTDTNFSSMNIYPFGNARMVVYDINNRMAKPARPTDIIDYLTAGDSASKILIRQRYYVSSFIVIYK